MDIIRRITSKLTHLYFIMKSARKEVVGKVLMFHSIGGVEDEFDISVEDFKVLLERLKGRNVIVLSNWEHEKDFVALTIDDVPENFYHNAYPLLKKYGIPFTLFVNVSLLDKEGFITKRQLLEMSQCGLCSIGSHGVSHGEYRKFNASEAKKELQESKAILEEIIGKPVEMYAFPYGSYYACGYANKHLVTEVYKYGFSTIKCAITESQVLPIYYLPRINVDSLVIEELSKA